MNTPYFLIVEEELNRNISAFEKALEKYWPNSKLAYSIKTNSLPWLLRYMKNRKLMAEAVSDEEYQLAKLCGFKDEEIIFNGPIKGKKQLKTAWERGAVVNLDSERELKYVSSCSKVDIEKVGIRINVNTSIFNSEDVAYVENGFRFGFSEEKGKVQDIVKQFCLFYGSARFGLHFHCNSVTRSLNVYRAIASYAAQIIERYHLTPSFIDIGGGFFGGVEGKPTADNYISIIRDELSPVVDMTQTKLIIEPGSAIVGSVIEYHTSVLDVKDNGYAVIVTTDGSRVHIDPLWKKRRYLYSVKYGEKNRSAITKQVICGYTCMDHDRIMTLENMPAIQTGDEIIYYRVGAYSVTFGGPFIRYFPDVYVKEDEHIFLIRKRISVEDYYRIQSVPDECGGGI